MKKVFSLFIFLCLSVIAVSAQTIGEIRFEGIKRTNQNYLLKMVGLSVGGNWNESIKSSAISKLTALDKIVEKVEITESEGQNDTVIVTINIQEVPRRGKYGKLPFLKRVSVLVYSAGFQKSRVHVGGRKGRGKKTDGV